MNSLSKFTNLTTPLPIFTPALGYTYYPPAPSKPTVAPQGSLAQSSRESSVAPAVPNPAAASQTSASLENGSNSTNAALNQASDPRDSYALFESFNLMLQYGDEYMDENPLRGEPGNFTFSSTKDRVRAKAAEAEAAKAKAKEQELAKKLEEARAAAAPTPFAGTATPEKVQSPTSETKPSVKRSKTGDKIKRRKSRVATSPTTPASPAVPSPMP